MPHYDVAIAGLGAMGASAALQLSKCGVRIIGFDRLHPPHSFGSSHGETRVTRLAIGEGEHLTPLAMRSHEIWREIEGEAGARLLSETGALIISSERNAAQTHVSGFFRRTVAIATKFGIRHEILSAAQIRARWPQFNMRDDELGYFEPTGGFVRPEECVRAELMLAGRRGAELHVNEPVLGFDASSGGVTVATDRGRYSADRLIIAAGAWLPDLLGDRYARLFKIYRQTQVWFEVEDTGAFAPERFPVFIWELQNSTRGIYGFPALDGARAVKIASECFETTTTPAEVNRDVSADEVAALHHLVAPNLRGVTSGCLKSAACLYTVTADFGFVIDTHPDCERIIIASPCSGHGFKHSPAIGEMLADMALGQTPLFDIAPFGLRRFLE
ncbi:MAG TPA: N-methyl-L-tryptophan oxidase [Rhizomicrobium sp.]|jgi:sarcosine oxidase|nr:N-methyl-L-tryptophan oxidase [Rhizomicrobium sp.]